MFRVVETAPHAIRPSGVQRRLNSVQVPQMAQTLTEFHQAQVRSQGHLRVGQIETHTSICLEGDSEPLAGANVLPVNM